MHCDKILSVSVAEKHIYQHRVFTNAQNSVADPGFSRGGGANSPGGGANIRFCKIFPKTA